MTYQEIACRYVAAVMENLHALTDEKLDEYRRWGENLGDGSVLGSDVLGHDLALACDHEIAGRFNGRLLFSATTDACEAEASL